MLESKKKNHLLLIIAIAIAGINLRASITCVGTLMSQIKLDLGLPNALGGVVTSIPVLMFGLFSPLAGKISSRLGLGKSIFLALCAIAVGSVIRSYCGTAGLFVGTLFIGAGIACENVLLPVVVKSQRADRIGPLTSIYTTLLSLFGGLSSAIAVPIAVSLHFGWKNTLAMWGLAALAGALVWLSQLKMKHPRAPMDNAVVNVWKSPMAWYITLYLGTQAIFYFGFISWLPSIAVSKGMSQASAGYLASAYQLLGIPANILTPLIATKVKKLKLVTGVVGFLYLLGIVLLYFANAASVTFAAIVFCGVSTGCVFSLSMVLIGLRSGSPATAAKVSVMSQTAGFLLAAFSPTMMSILFDRGGSWNSAIVFLIAAVVCNCVVGQLVAQEKTI